MSALENHTAADRSLMPESFTFCTATLWRAFRSSTRALPRASTSKISASCEMLLYSAAMS